MGAHRWLSGWAEDETPPGQLEGHQWNAHGTGDLSLGLGLRVFDFSICGFVPVVPHVIHHFNGEIYWDDFLLLGGMMFGQSCWGEWFALPRISTWWCPIWSTW